MNEEEIIKELKEPQSTEELDIPQNILIDILLRLLYNEGNVNFHRIVQVMRLPLVLDKLLEWMRAEKLVEIYQSTNAVSRLNYIYKLTKTGMDHAHEAMERSQYVGPAPVPVNKYNQLIELQTKSIRTITRQQVQQALDGLVLPDEFHQMIGPAINSGASIFMYGPSGNGKTTIAQKIAALIAGMDPVWLPYAITAGGQVIQIFDRLYHRSVAQEKISNRNKVDGRWGLFNRPSVIIGGELRMESLELKYDPLTKIYDAPLQIKANGGMILIDDFGRQQVSPSELLNRMIIPLENNIDYLRLRSGQTLVVPFRSLLMFCTNIDPYKLADDAFFRRIQMKVGVFSPDEERFRKIFMKVASKLGIPYDEASYKHLMQQWYRSWGREPQAVHPRDILRILKAICTYDCIPATMSPELLDKACKTYFVYQRSSKD